MNLRTSIQALVALPLLFGGVAIAAPFEPRAGFHDTRPAEAGALHALLPRNWLNRSDNGPSYQLAQADPRIGQLEEQVRLLNGRLEELNFLILQMQDDVRKMQEDNEFRLQQLEERRTDAGSRPAQTDRADGSAPAGQQGQANATAEPPRDLGSITFDGQGNPTGGTIETREQGLPGVDLPQAPRQAQSNAPDDTTVAALPTTNDPNELYQNAYSFILSGDYPTAEAGFREHIERFPNDAQAADAHYWLGEALLGMEQYRSAAEIFLAANREYPSSRKAPDMLLKLGVSLAALNQRDVACATYSEIGKRYADASQALKERVKAEQALAGC
jgi:tol-pal system protein YbgF